MKKQHKSRAPEVLRASSHSLLSQFLPFIPPVSASCQTQSPATVRPEIPKSMITLPVFNSGSHWHRLRSPGLGWNPHSEGRVRDLPLLCPDHSKQSPVGSCWGHQGAGCKDLLSQTRPGSTLLAAVPEAYPFSWKEQLKVDILLWKTACSFPSRRLTTLLHHLVGFGFNFLVFGKVSSGSFEVFFLHWRTLLFHRGWLRNTRIAHTSVLCVWKHREQSCLNPKPITYRVANTIFCLFKFWDCTLG